MSVPFDVEVAVVGGGPAGIAAALAAARADAAVALVEPRRVGGPTAMLAWRVLERTVDRQVARGSATRAAVWDEARAELRRLAPAREERLRLRLADAGVDVLDGAAAFAGPRSLVVRRGDARFEVRFDAAVIAAGAGPATLPGAAPDGARLVTPETLFDVAALPDEVMVIGGGAAGAELVDALSRLDDVTVTWVMDEVGILPRFERELADALGDVLLGRGVKLVHGKAVASLEVTELDARAKLDGGRTYAAPLAVICVGQRRDPSALSLDAAGLEAPTVDDALRTPVGHLFAAGACTGRCPSAAHAEAMGRIAGQAAAGLEAPTYDPLAVPLVVRAHPQLAQVGDTPERVAGQAVVLHTARGEESLAGLLDGTGETANAKGWVRLVCDSESGRLRGLSAVGPGSATRASAAAMALRLGATDAALAECFGDLPGALDGLFLATR